MLKAYSLTFLILLLFYVESVILFQTLSCCFSAKHATLRRKNKDWFALNQNNMSETGKRPRQVLAWDRHKNVTMLNQLMGSQPFSSCKVWIKQNIAKCLVVVYLIYGNSIPDSLEKPPMYLYRIENIQMNKVDISDHIYWFSFWCIQQNGQKTKTGPGLGQAQKCDSVKPVNGITTLLLV
jgi:hypothetical protein